MFNKHFADRFSILSVFNFKEIGCVGIFNTFLEFTEMLFHNHLKWAYLDSILKMLLLQNTRHFWRHNIDKNLCILI